MNRTSALMSRPRYPKMGVYAIVNERTHKVYIGSTQAVERRLYQHFSNLVKGTHRNSLLQRSFRRHGIESFRFELVEKVEDKASLIEREQYWMNRLRSYDRRFGYNLVALAERRHHSPETVEKIRHALTGRVVSDETRQRQSRALRGRKNPSVWTPERRAKTAERSKQVFAEHPEIRERLAAAGHARKGISTGPMPAETRAKLSASRKGKPKPVAHRLAIGNANRGRLQTPIARTNMKAAAQRRSLVKRSAGGQQAQMFEAVS